MQRYRSNIDGAFQPSPHRVDDRVLPWKKGTQWETSCLKRILEKYIEKHPLRPFSPSDFFLYLSFRRITVFSCKEVGRGIWEGGRCHFLHKSEKDVMKTNWQAVTIYLFWWRSALTRRGKTGPFLISVGLHFSFSSRCPFPSFYSIIQLFSISQNKNSCLTWGIIMRSEVCFEVTQQQLNVNHMFSQDWEPNFHKYHIFLLYKKMFFWLLDEIKFRITMWDL